MSMFLVVITLSDVCIVLSCQDFKLFKYISFILIFTIESVHATGQGVNSILCSWCSYLGLWRSKFMSKLVSICVG